MRIKNQLWMTHGLLVVLSLLIVLVNVIAYNGIGNDALIINQSGKLRALSYNMVHLTNQIQYQDDLDIVMSSKKDLILRVEEFDRALMSLNNQSNDQEISISHEKTLNSLKEIIERWNKTYKPNYLKIVNNESDGTFCSYINNDVELYVNEIDDMVISYSTYSNQKVNRALVLNGGLVLLIVIITFYSLASTYKRIQKPLGSLIEELKELSLIDDNLSEELKKLNTDEISEMTKYFNEMLYDQLTKTFNRRSGLAKLNKLFHHNNRRDTEISICFIDINGLKKVNDLLGHRYGDELIITAVDEIKKEIREEDFIIRMGGDEFLIVFIGINKEISETVWDRIYKRYQVINDNEERAYIISVSHGVAEYNNLEKSEVEILIKEADDKMYKEKRYLKEQKKIEVIK